MECLFFTSAPFLCHVHGWACCYNSLVSHGNRRRRRYAVGGSIPAILWCRQGSGIATGNVVATCVWLFAVCLHVSPCLRVSPCQRVDDGATRQTRKMHEDGEQAGRQAGRPNRAGKQVKGHPQTCPFRWQSPHSIRTLIQPFPSLFWLRLRWRLSRLDMVTAARKDTQRLSQVPG